jgi:hypothetical protein
MGARQSRPAAPPPPAPKPTPPPPPVNPITICNVKKVELNQLNADVTKKQGEVDTCDPQAAQTRKTEAALAANRAYIEQKRTELANALTDFHSQKEMANKLANATEPLQQYEETLTEDVERMDTKEKLLRNEERTLRRDFLDNSPQDGVSGFLGIRTSDDKIVLTFWICFGIALIAILKIVFQMFEAQIGDTKQQLKIGAVVVLVSYGIAYYCITKFG